MSAVAGPASVLKEWPAGVHTSTFQGNPVACGMASATVRTIREQGLLEHVANTVEPGLERLQDALAEVPRVGKSRIAGAQAAIDILNSAGAPDAAAAARIQAAALSDRLLVYLGGRHGNSIMAVPPINIALDDLEKGIDLLAVLIERELRSN